MRDLNQEEMGHVYGAGNWYGNWCGNSHNVRKDKCDRGSKQSKDSCGSKNSKNTKYC